MVADDVRCGGDPDRVTVIGQGSGAVSVHLHLLSPASEGLFSAAVALGASALDTAALNGVQRGSVHSGRPRREDRRLPMPFGHAG